ncbi:DUF3794 domain-containing protein [Clostridium aestuarii]|uniref:DUF3794 domain-containing protein n=1 Tax=Clostridium aestuarii TaxID=338193 RepID=A0ABT4CVZ7_9CLOT|nr:SPOCS domain-containing protein [Clostridium aestuarii]MCY6483164.1 DUF3794 domain-containing protein [Clostridium aestuarii]
MGVIRNHIDVEGITPEEQFPTKIKNGQILEYSEIENIFIPKYNTGIKNIFQIVIDVKVTNTKIIDIPLGKMVIIDGVKKIKIIYGGRGHSNKANIVNLELPYNTFFELPRDKEIGDINVLIVDAYFNLIGSRKVYGHIVYLVDIHYGDGSFSNKEKEVKQGKIKKQEIEQVEEIKEAEILRELSKESMLDVTDEILISKENINNEDDEKELIDIEAEYL